MRATIFNIRDTKNDDFKMIDFMPTRDADGIVHILEAKCMHTQFVVSLQLVPGDIVEL